MADSRKKRAARRENQAGRPLSFSGWRWDSTSGETDAIVKEDLTKVTVKEKYTLDSVEWSPGTPPQVEWRGVDIVADVKRNGSTGHLEENWDLHGIARYNLGPNGAYSRVSGEKTTHSFTCNICGEKNKVIGKGYLTKNFINVDNEGLKYQLDFREKGKCTYLPGCTADWNITDTVNCPYIE